MLAHRLNATLDQDGTLTLSDLPFQAGDSVEVIILAQPPTPLSQNPYPLRGTPIQYADPTEPVAEGDWEVAR